MLITDLRVLLMSKGKMVQVDWFSLYSHAVGVLESCGEERVELKDKALNLQCSYNN